MQGPEHLNFASFGLLQQFNIQVTYPKGWPQGRHSKIKGGYLFMWNNQVVAHSIIFMFWLKKIIHVLIKINLC